MKTSSTRSLPQRQRAKLSSLAVRTQRHLSIPIRTNASAKEHVDSRLRSPNDNPPHCAAIRQLGDLRIHTEMAEDGNEQDIVKTIVGQGDVWAAQVSACLQG